LSYIYKREIIGFGYLQLGQIDISTS